MFVSSTDQSDDVARLLEFLKNRDAPCPLCGYNLRNLTQPTCPECRQPLMLTVGMLTLRFGWFVISIAPGIFSGIAAVLMLIPLVGEALRGAPLPWGPWAIDAFGWLSGIATMVLILNRYAFLRLPPSLQCYWAITVWAIHLGTFALLIWLAF